jgi:hypothetical protein|eukprot:SAG25_NODE_1666_length_2576_cov_3.433993_3_plen_93_part_00
MAGLNHRVLSLIKSKLAQSLGNLIAGLHCKPSGGVGSSHCWKGLGIPPHMIILDSLLYCTSLLAALPLLAHALLSADAAQLEQLPVDAMSRW